MAQPNEWPDCDQIEGICPLYEMSQKSGVSILDALMTFLLRSAPGARLTLQRNRDEFTLQVTGAVQRSGGEVISLEQLREMRVRLDANEAHR